MGSFDKLRTFKQNILSDINKPSGYSYQEKEPSHARNMNSLDLIDAADPPVERPMLSLPEVENMNRTPQYSRGR